MGLTLMAAYNGRMARTAYDSAALQHALEVLPQWTLKSGKLHREYKFPDFSCAIGFMAMAAMHIEKLDHHPEWCNIYNRVTVDLTTHDAGGVTDRDVELAQVLDAVAGKLNRA